MKKVAFRVPLVALAASMIISGCGAGGGSVAVTPEEAEAIAKDAYIYGFPMVMNYKTIYNYVVDTSNAEYKGPLNQVACEARLFTPEDKAVVTPNADTPYCMFWMDLRSEPLVLTVPEMEPERFYHFQLIDLYTHNFAYVGTLTSGNGVGDFLLVGPGWDGERPEGISDVIRSETDFIFSITRTQLFGPDDLVRVEEIQENYGLQPLSAYIGVDAPPPAPMRDFPEWVEGSQFDERFFGYFDFMMSLLERPGGGEQELWDRLARLGIGPGQDFDFSALPPDIQEALKTGVEEGFAEIEEFIGEHSKDPLASAKVLGTREFLMTSAKTNYALAKPDILRSAAAHLGLYGNSAAEAIYPAYFTDVDQEPLNASANRYALTFEAGELPPVNAFWSLTMYDGQTQLFIDNPFDRYLVNSTMMDQFRVEDDGSLRFLVQNEPPGKELDGNWLPAPDGPFYMILRLYGPEPAALDGEWVPPAARKSE